MIVVARSWRSWVNRRRLRSQPCGELVDHPGPAQGAGEDVELGVELVQVPADPVLRPGALGDEVLTVIDQQFPIPRGLVVGRGGQVGPTLGGAGDREGVDRIGLAPGAG